MTEVTTYEEVLNRFKKDLDAAVQRFIDAVSDSSGSESAVSLPHSALEDMVITQVYCNSYWAQRLMNCSTADQLDAVSRHIADAAKLGEEEAEEYATRDRQEQQTPPKKA